MTATTYDPATVPARKDASRYALPLSASGMKVRPAQNANLVWEQQFGQMTAEPASQPEPFVFHRIVRAEGQLALIRVEERNLPAPYRNDRPQRYGKVSVRDGAALDSFFEQDEDGAWAKLTDDQVWKAALAHAEATDAHGDDLTRLSRLVNRALALRAGRALSPLALPF